MGWVLTASERDDFETLNGSEGADYVEARDLGATHADAMRLAVDTARMEAYREARY